MPQYPETKFIEIEGVDFVRGVVRKAGAIFRTFDRDDTGIDALIEFREGIEASGDLVALQIKSGQSYWSRDGSQCRIPIKSEWLWYWRNYSLPVVLIVYHNKEKKAVWLDVQLHLLEHPDEVHKTKLSFANNNLLNINAVESNLRLIARRTSKFSQVPRWTISRAETTLTELISLANRLHSEGCQSGDQALERALHEFGHIKLQFDGNITCLDTEGYCTLHYDPRLIGLNLGRYKDFGSCIEQVQIW